MTTTPSSEFFCVPEFQAEEWMAAIAPRVRRLALRHLFGCGLRGEVLDETADDIVSIMAMKAMRTPALCAVEAGALRAVAVRNEVVSWMRKYHRAQTVPLHDGEDDGDDPDGAPRTSGLPVVASAEEEAFPDGDVRARKLARLEEAFRLGARAGVAQLVREDVAFRRRLRASGTSRGALFAILRRQTLLATLLQGNGRDMDDAAGGEAEVLVARYGADLRTVRNRRSDWLRFLRERFARELAWCRQQVMNLFPEIRAA